MPQAHDVAAPLIATMAKDSASIVETVATGLCLASDRDVQGRLRELGGIPGRGPFLIKRGRLYFEIVGPRVKVHRRSIRDLLAVDLDAVLQSHVAFGQQLWDATTRSVHIEKAGRIVLPFVSAGSFPNRQHYRAIRPWIPAVEQLSYRIGTVAAGLLDIMRPHVLEGPRSDHRFLETYWAAMGVMGNAILLTTDAEARPWLTEMAEQFVWNNWTPTFPFLRERTIWLAAIAARSAAAFGSAMIERYFDALARASEPIKAFDALFGLSAIALSDFSVAPAVLKEIELRGQSGRASSARVERIFNQAIAVIGAIGEPNQIDPGLLHRLGWGDIGEKSGLSTNAALTLDPTSETDAGQFLGFALLPLMVAAPAGNFFPTSADTRNAQRLSRRTIAEIIARAWR